MRKLASVQRIEALNEIEGADRIEVADVLGWKVVVQKGLYEVGDAVVYFEIDSILPEREWSEFMRQRKFRVKTIKLRKQISQGLCIPLNECGIPTTTNLPYAGTDLTESLGIKKHDPQGDAERIAVNNKKKLAPHKWMLRFPILRSIHQLLYPFKKGGWPEGVPKTDETRIQNMMWFPKQIEGRELYATEKLDGQSVTFFYRRKEKMGFLKTGQYGVCSRNVWYKNLSGASNWLQMSREMEVEEALTNYCEYYNTSLAIQGEIIGEGIQGNKYKIAGKSVFFFNAFDIEKDRYLSQREKDVLFQTLGFVQVPRVHMNSMAERTDFLEFADGISVIGSHPKREGLVFRDVEDDGFSFKAISNRWLLKNED